MKRSTVSSILFAFMFGFTLSISAQAQDSKSSDNMKTINKDAKKEKRATKPLSLKQQRKNLKKNMFIIPLDRSGPTVSPRFNRELKWIKKFKLIINHYMNLPTELQLKTDQLIDDHRSASLLKFHDLRTPKHRNTNRADFRKSRKPADPTVKKPKNDEYIDGFQTYQERLFSGKVGRPELILFHTAELLDNLLSIIPDEHKKKMDELIIRWDLTYSGGLPDDLLLRIDRIIKSPLFDFTFAELDELTQITGTNMRKLGPGPKGRLDKKKMRKAYKITREEIFKKLTPAQQAEIEKSMKLIDEYLKIMEID